MNSNHWSTTDSRLGNTGRWWDLTTYSYSITGRTVAHMMYLENWRQQPTISQQSAHARPTCDLTRGGKGTSFRLHSDKSHWSWEETCFPRQKRWSWEFRQESNSVTEGAPDDWTRQHRQLSSIMWLPVTLRVPPRSLDFKAISFAKNFRLPQRYSSSILSSPTSSEVDG